MRKLVLLLALLQPLPALAEITGPTSSSTGNFTLQWQAGTLYEWSTSNQVLNTWSGNTANIAKTDGTYFFEEVYCDWMPYYGYQCWALDAHQVTVSGAQYPQSLLEQSNYDFQIRSGDFDNNGRTDLYVERLTAGPVDGSMQSYVVWNNTNGTLSTDKLTSTYAYAAQSASINSSLNLMVSDINADGFSDHFIERIDQVMGSQFEQEVAVFAPGTAANKERPQGHTEITSDVRSFVSDIARWSNDEAYFANNINTTVIPLLAFGYHCLPDVWDPEIYGYFGAGCFGYVYQVGTHTVQYGINFDALTVSGYLDAWEGTSAPTDYDLWQISQVFFGVFGVHAFGFDTTGTRHTTNFVASEEEEERILASIAWWQWMLRTQGVEIGVLIPVWHDYTVDNPICSTTDSWCTLENIACWGRHYHTS